MFSRHCNWQHIRLFRHTWQKMTRREEISIQQDTSGTLMQDSNKVTLLALVIMTTLITLITRNNGNRNTEKLGNKGNHGNVSNICTILNTSGMCQTTDERIGIMKLTATLYKWIWIPPIKSQILMIRQHIVYIYKETLLLQYDGPNIFLPVLAIIRSLTHLTSELQG